MSAVTTRFLGGLRPAPVLLAAQRVVLDRLSCDESRYHALGLYVSRHVRWRRYSKSRQERIVEGLMAQYRTGMTPWELFNGGRE